MPVVLREDGWKFVIYPNDHPPPHVHVRRAGGIRVKVLLPHSGESVRIVWFRDGPPLEAARAGLLVEKHADVLLAAWERIHGLP
ncbi:DUF4160 domain-containing protein [Longimicrobium terrae]|uniref:DUF4160 domain-containing protein n=1 Tax=Longimicrobium terrae TaxID=1639882 RepID=UPI00147419E1|nr:DUF4160 domain-containing protein [Longimicrobium terrae]